MDVGGRAIAARVAEEPTSTTLNSTLYSEKDPAAVDVVVDVSCTNVSTRNLDALRADAEQERGDDDAQLGEGRLTTPT